VAEETDIAIVLFHDADMVMELVWIKRFQEMKTPVIPVVSRIDTLGDDGVALAKLVAKKTGLNPLRVSAMMEEGIEELKDELIRCLPEDYDQGTITGNLAKPGDTVMLVMPQDIQAPKGRLILPQVQTLRELLEKGCAALCTRTGEMQEALSKLKQPPDLIITDSQAFKTVHALKPKESWLTSFSILFAGYKGDIGYFTASATRLGELPPNAHILIAEACTHRPLEEDIGRVKLPRLLRQRLGEDIRIEVVAGRDFPKDLTGVDMVIHCGACMFNRKYVLSRVAACRAQGVPMTNYGVAIAYLLGILDAVELPEPVE
jgi:[FeFe] hydrogenase H-cluster maturation GTPase HydF